MSISHRKHRAVIYSYRDGGADGVARSEYVRQSSGQSDHAWYCSLSQPTGREVTTGMKADHRVDAVLGFDGAITITENGAIVVEGVEYLVRAILPRVYGCDEWQVLAERSANPLRLLTS